MIKEILVYPDNKEVLSQISKETNAKECQDLIQDLKDTLKASTGVGIAAIQIGVPKRVCYINYNNEEIVMINPVITWTRNSKKIFQEGCLSSPKIYKPIERYQKVTCKYINENGEEKEISQGGWLSAIIQHELDHLDGICKVSE